MDRVDASRLGALISWAQSAELVVEVAAEMTLGESARQRVLTLLEVYKALCRVRLLRLQPAGSLLRSLPPDSGDSRTGPLLGAQTTRLGARAGVPTPLTPGRPGPARWPRASSSTAAAEPSPEAARSDTAQVMLTLGELLHIAQPVVHLLLVQLMPERWRASRRAWLPWLSALLLEAASLQLCTAATRSTSQSDDFLRDALRALCRLRASSEAHSADNLDELRHRRCAAPDVHPCPPLPAARLSAPRPSTGSLRCYS